MCENASKSNLKPGAHDCRKNFEGSAKSMESDMVVSMVKDMNEKGIKMGTLVADDDAATLCRLRAESIDISKESDKNHVRKNFSSALFSLQKQHKPLSAKVIKYISKCFNYALSQNKGNPEGLDISLKATMLSEIMNAVVEPHGVSFKQTQRADTSLCHLVNPCHVSH